MNLVKYEYQPTSTAYIPGLRPGTVIEVIDQPDIIANYEANKCFTRIDSGNAELDDAGSTDEEVAE